MNVKGYLAIITAGMLWGLAAPVQKIALSDFTPTMLSFWRFLVATCIFAIFYYWKKEKFPRDKKKIFALFAISSLFALGVIFYAHGLKHTTVSLAQVIALALPILTSLGSVVFLKEKITTLQFAGFLVGLSGLSLIVAVPAIQASGIFIGTITGNVLILLSALAMAGYFVGSKHIGHAFTASTLTFASLLTSLIIFFILSVVESYSGISYIPVNATMFHVAEIVYLGLFGSIITFYLFQYGIKHVGAFFAGLSPYIQLPIVILSGVLLFGDAITPIFIVGAILSISGALLASGMIMKR